MAPPESTGAARLSAVRVETDPDGNVVERDEAPLFTEKYEIPVQLAGGGQATDFVKVVENVQIPYVAGDNITIWVGFDSNG